MTPRSRRRLRWLVPVAAISATSIAAALPNVVPVGADPVPVLPVLTPAQLLAKVRDAHVTTLSGDITVRSNLGLPDLGPLGVGGGTFLDLLTGTHVAHMWVDGTDHLRLALDSAGAETDWIRNGSDVWAWDSSTQSVKHATLDTLAKHAGSLGNGDSDPAPSSLPLAVGDPTQAADALLAAIDPSTDVSVRTPGYVAGRPVYELVVAPKSPNSTIADGVISVDSATGTPLAVRIDAKSSATPALNVTFTTVSFDKPAASTFDFTVPPGAQLTEVANAADLLPLGRFGAGQRRVHVKTAPGVQTSTPIDPAAGSVPSAITPRDTGQPGGGPRVKLTGSNWDAVAIISNLPLGRQFQQLFSGSPAVTVGSVSGHLLSTSLINVLILDDGRIVVGAVTPAALESAVGGS
jgi:outer membrane lipoprotein-sorting protein